MVCKKTVNGEMGNGSVFIATSQVLHLLLQRQRRQARKVNCSLNSLNLHD